MRRGGTLRWQEQELELRPASKWRERYALADGERELGLLDGKGWGRRPVRVTVEDNRGGRAGAAPVHGLCSERDRGGCRRRGLGREP